MEKTITSTDNKIEIKHKKAIKLRSAQSLNGLNLATSNVAFKIHRHLPSGGTTTSLATPLINYISVPAKQLNPSVVEINSNPIANEGGLTEIIFENLGNYKIQLYFDELNQ